MQNRQWRERQTLEIQRRDELSDARKRETIGKAQGAVDDFYENYNSKRDKAIEQTRFVISDIYMGTLLIMFIN